MKLKRKLLIMIMIKRLTTSEFNKLKSEHFTARLKQADLASKNDIADFVKKIYFNNKLKDVASK